MNTDVLIVGGGLAGLALAEALHHANVGFVLVEADDRLGGRISSEDARGARFDLGPAWFWPGQPRMDALVTRLGLSRFGQFSDGDALFEAGPGQVQQGQGFASMRGSWRVEGGLTRLTARLAALIPAAQVRLGTAVMSLTRSADGIRADLSNGDHVVATRVVLALPPRIIGQDIAFSPALPETATRALGNVPTWMAGQAKAVAIYDRPFWRERGLSGDAVSRVGPMVEMHDASPADGSAGALFGFIGVPPDARQDTARLEALVLAQLGRLFGEQAARPDRLIVKDWAFAPRTATPADHPPLYAHPTYGLLPALRGLWDGRLIFAGTEVAPQFGGFLEGALEAAEAAAAQIIADLKTAPAQS